MPLDKRHLSSLFSSSVNSKMAQNLWNTSKRDDAVHKNITQKVRDITKRKTAAQQPQGLKMEASLETEAPIVSRKRATSSDDEAFNARSRQSASLGKKSKYSVATKKRKEKAISKDDTTRITKSSIKLETMKQQLDAARFRYLNELFYTTHSKDAIKTFKDDPSAFDVYHRGYRSQIDKWPVKPIELAIRFVNRRPPNDVVADLGCGEAVLALKVKQRVHSFDIKALNERVIIADIANVPLEDKSVNVAVFCLSLMGTNMIDFLREACRILVDNGMLWIAEVASRFEGDLNAFSAGVESLGFRCMSCDTQSTHFVIFTFKKVSSVKKTKAIAVRLAPCLYKRR